MCQFSSSCNVVLDGHCVQDDDDHDHDHGDDDEMLCVLNLCHIFFLKLGFVNF